MVSKRNLRSKLETDAKRIPHWSLRKLSVGVASVLLGTTLFFGINAYAATDSLVTDTQPAISTITNNSTSVTNTNQSTAQSTSQSSATTNKFVTPQNTKNIPVQQYNAQANTVEATQPISDDAYTLSNASVKSFDGQTDTDSGYQDVSFDMTLNPSKVKAGDYLDVHTGIKVNGSYVAFNNNLQNHSDLVMNTGDVIGEVNAINNYSDNSFYRITFNDVVTHYQNAKVSVDLKFSNYGQSATYKVLYTHNEAYKENNKYYYPKNDAIIGNHIYTIDNLKIPVIYYPVSKSKINDDNYLTNSESSGITWYRANDGSYLYSTHKGEISSGLIPGEKCS